VTEPPIRGRRGVIAEEPPVADLSQGLLRDATREEPIVEDGARDVASASLVLGRC
jgi:hypothetical protein